MAARPFSEEIYREVRKFILRAQCELTRELFAAARHRGDNEVAKEYWKSYLKDAAELLRLLHEDETGELR